jgi:hypothetical protein
MRKCADIAPLFLAFESLLVQAVKQRRACDHTGELPEKAADIKNRPVSEYDAKIIVHSLTYGFLC